MPHVISFINFKGGVGKTTTLVQVAETLSAVHGKKVLVLDLDPQTNATVALIGDTAWQKVDADQQTLAHLFFDMLDSTSTFDLSRAVIRGVSNLPGSTIDLIPSSIHLVEVQDRLSDISVRTAWTMAPMEVVKLKLGGLFKDYDFVLIDCPPNLGFITQNGLEVSDYYVTPVVPDVLSTYGLPQIIRRIHDHAARRKLGVQSLGVVVTKYDSRRPAQDNTRRLLPRLLSGYYAKAGATPADMFQTVIPAANRYSEVMDYDLPMPSHNYKEKWGTSTSGGQQLYTYPQRLTQEILDRL